MKHWILLRQADQRAKDVGLKINLKARGAPEPYIVAILTKEMPGHFTDEILMTTANIDTLN